MALQVGTTRTFTCRSRASRPGRTLPTSGPLLLNHELVRPTEEDLARQVPPQFATEGAFNRDGLERELLPTGGNHSPASLARDNECLAACGREHASIIAMNKRIW
jgi:hypothetical protein